MGGFYQLCIVYDSHSLSFLFLSPHISVVVMIRWYQNLKYVAHRGFRNFIIVYPYQSA